MNHQLKDHLKMMAAFNIFHVLIYMTYAVAVIGTDSQHKTGKKPT